MNITKQIIYDITIVGAGIVGSAVARNLLKRNPQLKLLIVDRENEIAKHQSSHNSGVIHRGIYYQPGSKRAKLCVKGSMDMYHYCQENGVYFEKCGKLITAVNRNELDQLEKLYQRGLANGVNDIELVDRDRLLSIEPSIVGGIKAIFSPNTGIVDFKQVTQSLVNDSVKMGAEVKLNFDATNFNYNSRDKILEVRCKETNESIHTKYMITCAGIYSDRVANASFGEKEPSVVPFRGSFLKFKPQYSHLIKGNVYPVPNANFPFLGVHFTKKTNGDIWIGPNAVLAFDRKGYKYSDVNLQDTKELLTNKGLRSLATRHWKYGMDQLMSDIFPSHYIKFLKPFIPDITTDMLEYGGSGVRAQAISQDGHLIEDFIYDTPLDKPIIHVRNCPSPAATSSLAIADEIVDMAYSHFNFH
ncbi:hypothetical protein CYY_008381 [Polysphondylium violaceum]|uniref:L-2-hydroxyglutarate dehydrogenase, mitochondrial n=1 Tax=Polysphondylium violaceum TaxID=133409 RepID=A0A8J4PVB3_9MYCE|nr:hypothetical protein CYY_008381 [Polysphondylium violaceum]